MARDTVEEKIIALQQIKRELADALITQDNSVIAQRILTESIERVPFKSMHRWQPDPGSSLHSIRGNELASQSDSGKSPNLPLATDVGSEDHQGTPTGGYLDA